MDIDYIKVVCDGCRKGIDSHDSCYCLDCIDDKENKIESQAKEIARLEEEVNKLNQEIRALERAERV